MIIKNKVNKTYESLLCLDENLLKACNDMVYSKLNDVDMYDKIQSFLTESIFYLDKKMTIFKNNVEVSNRQFKDKKSKTINTIKMNSNLNFAKIKVLDKSRNIDCPNFVHIYPIINKDYTFKEINNNVKNINTKFMKTLMGNIINSKSYKYNSNTNLIQFNNLQTEFEKKLYIDYYNTSSKEDILQYIDIIQFDFYTYGKVQDILSICINKLKGYKKLDAKEICYSFVDDKDKTIEGSLRLYSKFLKQIFDLYNMVSNIIMSLTSYKNLYAYNLFDYNLNNILNKNRINLSESVDFIDYNTNNIFVNDIDNITDIESIDIDISNKLKSIIFDYLEKINSKINMIDNIDISKLEDIKDEIYNQAYDADKLFNNTNISFTDIIGLDYTDISSYLYQYKVSLYDNKHSSVEKFLFNNKDIDEVNDLQLKYKNKAYVSKDEIQEKIMYLIDTNKLLDSIIYDSTNE